MTHDHTAVIHTYLFCFTNIFHYDDSFRVTSSLYLFVVCGCRGLINFLFIFHVGNRCLAKSLAHNLCPPWSTWGRSIHPWISAATYSASLRRNSRVSLWLLVRNIFLSTYVTMLHGVVVRSWGSRVVSDWSQTYERYRHSVLLLAPIDRTENCCHTHMFFGSVLVCLWYWVLLTYTRWHVFTEYWQSAYTPADDPFWSSVCLVRSWPQPVGKNIRPDTCINVECPHTYLSVERSFHFTTEDFLSTPYVPHFVDLIVVLLAGLTNPVSRIF